jgi:hypothetical protein
MAAIIAVIPSLYSMQLMSNLPPDWESACGGAEAMFCPQEQLQIAGRAI